MNFQKIRIGICAFALSSPPCHAELEIPGFTAYTLPNPDAARISDPDGVTRWNDPDTSVNWYGKFEKPGGITARVKLKLPAGTESQLSLTVGRETRRVTVKGSADPIAADFGKFQIAKAGYQRFALASLNPEGRPAGDIVSLVLDGPALKDAHFNLKERRNAASVHLAYETPRTSTSHVFTKNSPR